MFFASLLNLSRHLVRPKAIYRQGLRQSFILLYNNNHWHSSYRSLSILVAGTTATLATTTATSKTALGRFQFQSYPRYYSVQDLTSSLNHDSEDSDCPLCRKYSQGPCGTLFQTWRQCTKHHEETYLKDCAQQFEKLQSCLEQHQDYYCDDDDDDDDNHDDDDIMDEKQQAWQELIDETLNDLNPQPFPTKPILQFQNHHKVATACFVQYTNLVFCFVQDNNNNNKTLLAAGSKQDLQQEKEYALLHFPLLSETTSITVSAVYEQPADDRVILYQHEHSIPAEY